MRAPSCFKKIPWLHIGALLFLTLLMLVDFKVAFHRGGHLPGAFGLSVINSEARASNPYAAAYGSRFVAVRSDIWNCYRIRETMHFNFGMVTIPDRCQEQYMVVVQTEACQQNKSETLECTVGTWRWVPNPPCGSDSPAGWYLPPC
jgi:hypothetical protein